MFCPNCGKADQTVDTYCRGCGEFLADLSNPFSLFSRLLGINTPAKQITVNLIINLVTAGVSILLVAFLNGYFDGRAARTSEAAPPIVYLVYVFLGLVAAWQFLSFVLNLKLKARFQGAGRLSFLTRAKPRSLQKRVSAYPKLTLKTQYRTA